MPPEFSFIVFRCKDIEKTKRFYETLGLTFIKEKHGSGPEHYASQLASVTFELYPATEKHPPTLLTTGFKVNDLETTIQELQKQTEVGMKNNHAVANDPDGRLIHIERYE